MDNKSMRCCGNCGAMVNRIIHVDKDTIKILYPKIKTEDILYKANVLYCRQNHHPNHFDNVCKDWYFDLVHEDDRMID